MRTDRLAPTRMNLLRARRDLRRVERGVTLTRRKREALVMELFAIARPAVDLRAKLTETVTEASHFLIESIARHGTHELAMMSRPLREPEVDLRAKQSWGIDMVDVEGLTPLVRSIDARGLAPSLTGAVTAETAERFERLVEKLIEAAPREQRMRRLGEALARTNRRLRTLEQRLSPSLKASIKLVRQQLEEREREEQLRVRLAQRP